MGVGGGMAGCGILRLDGGEVVCGWARVPSTLSHAEADLSQHLQP